MKENYFILGMSSLYPQKYSEKLWKNREEDYFLSLKSIFNLNLPIDLYVFDNTVNNVDEITSLELKKILNDQVADFPIFISKFIGLQQLYNTNNDKGFIELLIQTKAHLSQIGLGYKYVTIVNLRRYFISSYWFDLVERLVFSEEFDILVVKNKQTELSTMKVIPNNDSNLINDFIFTIRIDLFIEYINFIQEYSFTDKTTSHDLLWKFIQNKKYFMAENVGIMRNEWDVDTQNFSMKNMFFS